MMDQGEGVFRGWSIPIPGEVTFLFLQTFISHRRVDEQGAKEFPGQGFVFRWQGEGEFK